VPIALERVRDAHGSPVRLRGASRREASGSQAARTAHVICARRWSRVRSTVGGPKAALREFIASTVDGVYSRVRTDPGEGA
jgi:hypothetical protein